MSEQKSPPTRDETFADAFESFVAALVQRDMSALLRCLVAYSADLIGQHAVALAPRSGDDPVRLLAASPEENRLLGLFQAGDGDDPASSCMHTGEVVCIPQLGVGKHPWPHFDKDARERGFAAFFAAPIRAGDGTFGALTVLCMTPGSFTNLDLETVRSLANQAGFAIWHHRAVQQCLNVSHQLQTALNSRVIIEQAKGYVAAVIRQSPEVTFELLRSYARSHNRRLYDVCHDVVSQVLSIEEVTSETRRKKAGHRNG